MHCCCVYVVIPCQVAWFHALPIGEHCCTRLQGSVQCCCVLLSFSVRYCRVLCGVCRVWCCHAWLLIPGWQVCTHHTPFWPAEYTVTCIFLFSAPLCHRMLGCRIVGHYCCACYVPGGQWWLLHIGQVQSCRVCQVQSLSCQPSAWSVPQAGSHLGSECYIYRFACCRCSQPHAVLWYLGA